MNTKAKAVPVEDEVSVPVVATLTRDQIRAALLGKTPLAKSKLINVFGIDLELRQPSLGSIMDTRENDDAKARAADMIVKYAYVPGTDELVFEATDRDLILRWPFGEDLLALQTAITELTGLDIDAAVEDLRENPLAE